MGLMSVLWYFCEQEPRVMWFLPFMWPAKRVVTAERCYHLDRQDGIMFLIERPTAIQPDNEWLSLGQLLERR
jgi:hypothetical protein